MLEFGFCPEGTGSYPGRRRRFRFGLPQRVRQRALCPALGGAASPHAPVGGSAMVPDCRRGRTHRRRPGDPPLTQPARRPAGDCTPGRRGGASRFAPLPVRPPPSHLHREPGQGGVGTGRPDPTGGRRALDVGGSGRVGLSTEAVGRVGAAIVHSGRTRMPLSPEENGARVDGSVRRATRAELATWGR